MTYPTKAIYKLIQVDSLKIAVGADEDNLFDRNDINNSLEKITPINYHEEIKYKGIKFTCYNAGHVLGGCMFLVDIAGVKILYTGDYSREKDRHIQPAEIPNERVDVLIVESTYGIKLHEPREIREKMFVETVHSIIKRGGHCQLPVYVLGRTQELQLILDEYWANNPDQHDIPMYYASTLMTKCMLVFQTYINMTGDIIRNSFKHGDNPFTFKHIEVLKNIDNSDLQLPSVIIASPGMLQKGLSRALFEKWCHDDRNGLILTGYCVESTFASDILNGKRQCKGIEGNELNVRMSVDYISFSAHCDFNETKDFIKCVDPKHIILVHGEKHEAERLKKELDQLFPNISITSPKNGDTVAIDCKEKKTCKIYGKLAEEIKNKVEDQKQKRIVQLEAEEEEKIKELEKHRLENEQFLAENVDNHNQENSDTNKIEQESGIITDKPGNIPQPPPGPPPLFSMAKESITPANEEGLTLGPDENNGDKDKQFSMSEEEMENYIAINIEGIMLKKNFNHILLNETDVRELVGKENIKIDQKIYVGYCATLQLAYFQVEQIYCQIKFVDYDNRPAILVQGEILISKVENKDQLAIEWKSSKKNDIIADCLGFMLSQIPHDTAIDIFNDSYQEARGRVLKRRKLVTELLRDAFPDFVFELEEEWVKFNNDGISAKVNADKLEVNCDNIAYANRIYKIIENC